MRTSEKPTSVIETQNHANNKTKTQMGQTRNEGTTQPDHSTLKLHGSIQIYL